MGPITLFDKSFLQSLTENESVWFGHYYAPMVCPLFYVETLADLNKDVGEDRTPEREVRKIARKFPETGAYPCTYHATVAIAELLGNAIPMDGRIPRFGGRMVQKGGRTGVVYEQSVEEEAFGRWLDQRFLDVERLFANAWRSSLGTIRLEDHAGPLRALGVDAKTCQSLAAAHDLAQAVVTGRDNHFRRMELAIGVLNVPRQHHRPIVERWASKRYPPLSEYVPYVAHILAVELFFLFALAAHQISTQRASNRIDIAYLHYLPFAHVFVSSDKLHRRCAPLFLRGGQAFIWGPDLKADLRRIDEYFMSYPEHEKERGIMAFASRAPDLPGSITRELRKRFMRRGIDDEPEVEPPPKDDPRSRELLDAITDWENAPPGQTLAGEPEFMSIARKVRKKKGDWYQLPKDLPNSAD